METRRAVLGLLAALVPYGAAFGAMVEVSDEELANSSDAIVVCQTERATVIIDPNAKVPEDFEFRFVDDNRFEASIETRYEFTVIEALKGKLGEGETIAIKSAGGFVEGVGVWLWEPTHTSRKAYATYCTLPQHRIADGL